MAGPGGRLQNVLQLARHQFAATTGSQTPGKGAQPTLSGGTSGVITHTHDFSAGSREGIEFLRVAGLAQDGKTVFSDTLNTASTPQLHAPGWIERAIADAGLRAYA